MKAILCDICKEPFDPNRVPSHGRFPLRVRVTRRLFWTESDVDVCSKCVADFHVWRKEKSKPKPYVCSHCGNPGPPHSGCQRKETA